MGGGTRKPCHMPCGNGGKGHGVPTSTRVRSFAPVTLEKATGMITDLALSHPIEPWQCPNSSLCYAAGKHVLTHAPAVSPASKQALVKLCPAAYTKWTTHAFAHSRAAKKERAEEAKQQLMEEQGAAGDQVEPPPVYVPCFRVTVGVLSIALRVPASF